jgi:hypothetical protein
MTSEVDLSIKSKIKESLSDLAPTLDDKVDPNLKEELSKID